MASLQELLQQRSELEAAIASLQSTARAEAVTKIKALMAEFGLTFADITSGRAPKAAAPDGEVRETKKAPVKYRNAATGDTWSGRGLQPKWLKAAVASGAKIDDFLV
jgi:DNA-binding protein H-NS